MGADGKIEWTDHTFNPWIGCTKISPACDHCYAETWAQRYGQANLWQGERRRTSANNWRQPLRWNAEAERAGVRKRVFCASLADVFDNQVDGAWRCDLWDLIHVTPHLDWLLLTKRPQNMAVMLPQKARGALADWGDGWPNVWLGTTVENQTEAEKRIPYLLSRPAAKRFLSCEPLLGPVNLRKITTGERRYIDAITGARGASGLPAPFPECLESVPALDPAFSHQPRIDWVIAGGESGPGARPSHPEWFRALRDQCVSVGVPFFFKQWGDWVPWETDHLPNLRCQDGRSMDRHHLPDIHLADNHLRWTDDLLFSGDDWCVHERVGKRAAGATLDGREWREVPT